MKTNKSKSGGKAASNKQVSETKATSKKTTAGKNAPDEDTKRSRTPESNGKMTPPSKRTDEKEFPGYPPYNPDEDITKRSRRVDENLDDEMLTEIKHQHGAKSVNTTSDKKMPKKKVSSHESDLTKEDLEALGPKDLSMDMGEDEQLLKHRIRPVDFTGKDLDIPGTELDDQSEEIGSEDEENNLYSQGGDDKDSLEERKD